jgi:membrane protein YqaA with SNARE-associated domain
MKHFGKIIWVMMIVAVILGATTTYMIGSRLQQMETNINEINSMLKDMTLIGNTPEG